MNKEFLRMQKLAGLITESQVKALFNEIAIVRDFSKKIKAGDERKLNDALRSFSGEDRPLANSIFKQLKANSDGLTAAELAKALRTSEEKIKDIISAVPRESIFKTEIAPPPQTSNRTIGRPTS